MFLRKLDYLKQIQTDNFAQIIESDESNRVNMELAAQAEINSYLVQRYDMADVFRDTETFSISATYGAKSLVEYTETAWSSATAYLIGNRVVYSGKIYSALTNNTNKQPNTNPSDWQYVVDDKQLYYGNLPNAEWVSSTAYSAGTTVWYKGKTYTSVVENTGVKPDSSIATWGAGSVYSFTGFLPTDLTKWTKGDNRPQQIVLYMVDVTLYHLHARINPRNIPQLRLDRYDDAVKWLKAVASGDITAALPEIYESQGVSIRYGVSNTNTTLRY